MTKRLMSWAENTDQLPTEQSGFRKHHLTNDELFELTQAVCQAQRLSTRVGAVFLDIEKAFDRVWHNGLRYELLHMNAPALLLRWISSFLSDRTVKVRILGQNLRLHIQGNCDQLWYSPRKPYQSSTFPTLPV